MFEPLTTRGRTSTFGVRTGRGAAVPRRDDEGSLSMVDRLRRLILVRHGETVGRSSIRYYGVTDVPLSELGRAQVRAARDRMPGETYQAVWASTLCRSWQSARIVARGRPVHLESDFREIDFGRWEGLTIEEIREADPELHARWLASDHDFTFPGGESRAAFRSRIARGLDRLRASHVESALVVVHKGVVRTLLELVTGHTLAREDPELGGVVHATRDASGAWRSDRL